MNKFVERAIELRSRLSLVTPSTIPDMPVSLLMEIERQDGRPAWHNEFTSLALDVLILLHEFQCLPLYRDAEIHRDEPDYLMFLLDKMIETAEFRSK